MKLIKYSKVVDSSSAMRVYIWVFHVIFFSGIRVFEALNNVVSFTSLFFGGFGFGMLISNYMCYKTHSLKRLVQVFQQEVNIIIDNTKLILSAEDIIKKKEDKGF